MAVQDIFTSIGRIVVMSTVALAAILISAADPATQTTPQRTPGVQGVWQNGESTVRITVNKSEIKGVFEQIGQLARDLGFRSKETTLFGTVRDSYMYGEQTIRYGADQSCYRERGRKVPMMGRLREDGQVLAIHFYNIRIDANCRDTGLYDITETLWTRMPER